MEPDIIAEVLCHSGVQKAMAPAFSPHEDDLRRLLALLDLAKPRAILEFGSGWSTLVMARWLIDHPGSFVEALEGDPHYYTVTYRGLGAIHDIAGRFVGDNLMVRQVRRKEWEPNERWRVLFSPVANGQHPDGVVFTYQCLTTPDFIYLDGPALWGKRIITENAITHLNHDRPMVFLIDGRMGCASHVWQYYRRRLKLPYEWLYCAEASCSLVYHETFSHVGEWFEREGPCQRAKESES